MTPDLPVGSGPCFGRIEWVRIDLGDDDRDATPEERLRVAIARQ